MTTFDLYAAYYDLLYSDKDYASEVDYILGILPAGLPLGARILELGCGTGGHAFELATRGFRVHGIDISENMVVIARSRLAALPAVVRERLSFDCADMRGFHAGKSQFDLALSLFHVMSYATTNADQQAAFASARHHLAPGGLFVFDFWYGPAVLSDRPRHATKNVANEDISVLRKTVPVMRINQNCVDVCFEVTIAPRAEARAQTFNERHRMRYLFLPEIEESLAASGFEMMSSQAWLTREPLDDRSWYGCVVARAR